MAAIKLLQFGAGGQLGRELHKAQARAGDISATILSRAEADFSRPQDVAAAVMAVKPELVVNAVAYTAVDKAESDEVAARAVNAEAVGALAEACNVCGIPLIHVSTDYVYDGTKSSHYAETDPVNPLSAYGRTKLEGENRIRAVLPQHVILRTSWLYSAYGANFVKTMLRLGTQRDELRVVDDQWGAPTSAADLATTILKISRQLMQGSAAYGTFHFAGTGETTWRGFAEEIFRQALWAHIRAGVIPITSAEYPTPARRPANSRLDLHKIGNAFGIIPPTWQSSLALVLAELEKDAS